MPASWLWQQDRLCAAGFVTICETDARESDCHQMNDITGNTVGQTIQLPLQCQ